MTAAERVREQLAPHRAGGHPFDTAWPAALAEALRGEGHRAEWVEVLNSTRPAWAAAYRREPATRAERAVHGHGQDPEREQLRDGRLCEQCWGPIPAGRQASARYCGYACQRAANGRRVPEAA